MALIPLILVSLMAFAFSENSQKCNMTMEEANNYAKTFMMVGDRNAVYVTGINDMDQHCKSIKDGLDGLKKYKGCLKMFPREIFNVLIHSGNKMINSRCNKKGRQLFSTHAICLTRSNSEPLHRCVDDMGLRVQYTQANMKLDDQIPALCCTANMLKKCLTETGDQICRNITGPDTGPYFGRMVDTVISDALDLICGKFGTIENCDALQPDTMKAFRKIESDGTNGKGVVVALLELVSLW